MNGMMIQWKGNLGGRILKASVGGSLVSQTLRARRRMSRTTVRALLAIFVEQSLLG